MSFRSADGIVQAEMARGSLQIWTDHVLYGAGANRSDAARFGAGAAYILGWLRQEENQCLAVPPEIARTPSGESSEACRISTERRSRIQRRRG